MSKKSNSNVTGLSFFSILGLIFIVLKLTGVINWSWWWVLAPLWGSALFALLFMLFILFIFSL